MTTTCKLNECIDNTSVLADTTPNSPVLNTRKEEELFQVFQGKGGVDGGAEDFLDQDITLTVEAYDRNVDHFAPDLKVEAIHGERAGY